MARFFFVDQSLKGVGGHHYDYALHVIRAAERLGLQTTLATHRAFRGQHGLPKSCCVRPVFRHSVYNRFSEFAPDKERRAGRAFRNQRRFSDGRQRVIDRFRDGLSEVFAKKSLTAKDHVFLATISELELLGLAKFLDSEPNGRPAKWSCQFHFNIFQGRPSEYESQSNRLEQLRAPFLEALEVLRHYDVQYFCTSDELVDQYRRLDVVSFDTLTYPVNPNLTPAKEHDPQPIVEHDRRSSNFAERPARAKTITLAGAVRHEKGQAHLAHLIEAVDESLLLSGLATFLIQRKRRAWYRRQQVDAGAQSDRRMRERISEAIQYADHPLTASQYEQLLRKTDVGLFLYDGRTYYARRAGILGEFLSLGVPVVVPDGCWLSEQIREENQKYIRKVAQSGIVIPHIPRAPRPIDARQHAQSRGADSDIRWSFDLELPTRTSHVAIECALAPRDGTIAFLRCNLAPHEKRSQRASTDRVAVMLRAGGGCETTHALLPIEHQAERVKLDVVGTGRGTSIQLGALEVRAIQATDTPLGVIGLAAADRFQVPRLLHDVVRHHAHYRNTAQSFALAWHSMHDPIHVMQQLLHIAPSDNERVA